ncbi:hypothetical protein XENTR_v10012478 [Xenopus tropicalis]|nr:hypothetical protein XENTR_v10012478 [Xenopus tropicalis]
MDFKGLHFSLPLGLLGIIPIFHPCRLVWSRSFYTCVFGDCGESSMDVRCDIKRYYQNPKMSTFLDLKLGDFWPLPITSTPPPLAG